MGSLRLTTLAVFLIPLAVASNAHAGGYLGAGIGSQSQLDGSISNHFSTDEDSSSSRVVIGQRFGDLALEASLFGTQINGASSFSGTDNSFTTISLGVDLKYHIGIVGGLEAYGKVGLNKTWLSNSSANEGEQADWGYEGRGHGLGLGLQYRFNLGMTQVSLWGDYTRQQTELRDGNRRALDGQLGMMNLGLSLGF